MSDHSKLVRISRILHAGYVFECEGQQIAFDPLFENPFSHNCYAFPSVQFETDQIKKLSWSAVFISHFHDDHCSLESLDLLDRRTPLYIFCLFDEIFDFVKQMGFSEVHALTLNQTVQVGPFAVTPRRALDEDVDSLFQIEAAGQRILNVVDSWIDEEILELLKKQGPWDMILWPFQTMRELEVIAPRRALPAPAEIPAEWKNQLQVLKPKYLVPSSCQFVQESWSWYNKSFFPISYKLFQEEVRKILPQTRVVRMNPSVSFYLDGKDLRQADPLPWIKPVGSQDVDYDYQPDLVPPSTAEVAKHFPALDESQKERVWNFCREGLLEKYRSMDPPQDPYFLKPRLWRLSVYDDQGQPTQFHYLVQEEKIQSASADEGTLAWLTEVPLTKLYAALEKGESLTSMYMRINDGPFLAAVEEKIQDVDIVEDPLVRCLFTGAFGAYQRAQLHRLQSR